MFRLTTTMSLAVLLGLGTQLPVAADEADCRQILAGVSRINASGLPGPVAPFGPEAFAVAVGGSGKAKLPLVAATRFGKGCAMAFGKGEFFIPNALDDSDNARFLANCLVWASGKEKPQVGVIACPGFADALRGKGVAAKDITVADVGSVDAIVTKATRMPREQIAALRQAVTDGKGLLVGGLGWGWLQLNPGKTLAEDHAGNQLFAPMGIVWLDGMLKRTTSDGKAYDTTAALPAFTNASLALDAALARQAGKQKMAKDDLPQASALLASTAQALPSSDTILLPRIRALLKDTSIDVVPTPKHPLRESDLLPRLVLTMQMRELEKLPPEKVTAHPAAATFPGPVPANAPRVDGAATIDPTVPGWASTGMYAAPGELITLIFPADKAKAGYKVRIGSTTCRLWSKPFWSRAPAVTREFKVTAPEVKAASPFGGLLYVIVPKKATGEPFSVAIAHAVAAPYFVAGKTDPADWRARIRNLPAPRAELTCEKAILTVPSEFVRQLDDPTELMQTWTRVVNLAGELAAWEPGTRTFPQRYTADCQLCAGYMHAGNPIMVPISTADELVDNEGLLAKGSWGFFHETGHNHQSRDWTFGGTGEVTVNLFTMYIMEKLCGIPPEKGRMGGPVRRSVHAYFATKRDFSRWKSDPFLALYMYYQMEQAFGWDAFKKVFAEYRALPEGEHPKTDDERRDQWLVRFSRTVGRNLGPFFDLWGVPVSEAAKKSVADLPIWMPENFPPPNPREQRVAKKAVVIACDSEQGKGNAAQAVDGFADTIWHTQYRPTTPQPPHFLAVDLGETMQLRGVTILPRQRGENGWIRRCEIYLSDDGTNWGAPVAKAEFARDKEFKTVRFAKPHTARYLKLVALEGFEDQPWTTIAELDVIR
jgi:hypothetical protein